jgi:hypothetical protein
VNELGQTLMPTNTLLLQPASTWPHATADARLAAKNITAEQAKKDKTAFTNLALHIINLLSETGG